MSSTKSSSLVVSICDVVWGEDISRVGVLVVWRKNGKRVTAGEFWMSNDGFVGLLELKAEGVTIHLAMEGLLEGC